MSIRQDLPEHEVSMRLLADRRRRMVHWAVLTNDMQLGVHDSGVSVNRVDQISQASEVGFHVYLLASSWSLISVRA